MRKIFAELLLEAMDVNPDIYFITADLGFGLWDKIVAQYPTRFINVGAAEQLALGIAIGLAQSGKIPFVYSITPFLICRPFELIRNYLHNENTKVILVGAGRNQDYLHDGFSHWATDINNILRCFPNIRRLAPNYIDQLPILFDIALKDTGPCFLSLTR